MPFSDSKSKYYAVKHIVVQLEDQNNKIGMKPVDLFDSSHQDKDDYFDCCTTNCRGYTVIDCSASLSCQLQFVHVQNKTPEAECADVVH